MTTQDRLVLATLLGCVAMLLLLVNEINIHLIRLTIIARDARPAVRASMTGHTRQEGSE